jgi:iron-sulfur cluster repair protein YtfE (RIC family)
VACTAAEIVRAFDSEILDHFQFEERVLFPLLEPYEGLADIVSELRTEHSRIAGLVTCSRHRSEIAHVTEFCSALRRHVRKEETVLFERPGTATARSTEGGRR